MPDARLVFLAPPSWDELERRLTGRGTEPPDVIAARLAQARVELAAADEFDAVVVNDDVDARRRGAGRADRARSCLTRLVDCAVGVGARSRPPSPDRLQKA